MTSSARSFALLAFAFFLFSCKKAEQHPSHVSSEGGWTIYEDSRFKFEIPTTATARSSDGWDKDKSPQFIIQLSPGQPASAEVQFTVYPMNPDLLIRDAAEADLRKWVKEGGRPLSTIKSLSTKLGSCAAYIVASGEEHCAAPRPPDQCNQDHFLAYCDSPKGKRYWFDGPLGATPNKNQRPPNSARLAADYERILRSIEFK